MIWRIESEEAFLWRAQNLLNSMGKERFIDMKGNRKKENLDIYYIRT
jgi:hypothetical protein